MKNRAGVFWSWFFVSAYAGLIFSLSSFPHPLPEDIQKYFSDWVLHLVEYGVFGYLLARAFLLTYENRPRVWVVGMAFLFGLLYAILDEFHQSFVPNRFASMHDVVADGAGLLISSWMRTKCLK